MTSPCNKFTSVWSMFAYNTCYECVRIALRVFGVKENKDQKHSVGCDTRDSDRQAEMTASFIFHLNYYSVRYY